MQKGERVLFHCISYGSAKWNFSDGSLPNDIIHYQNDLLIRNANEYHTGIYECRGQSKYIYWNGNTQYVYSRAVLVVTGKFKIRNLM